MSVIAKTFVSFIIKISFIKISFNFKIGGNMTFGDKLKKLRLEKKMTIRDLARAINVSPSTIKRWESGNYIPYLRHIYNLAVFFKVRSDYLVGLIDVEK